MRKKTNFDIVNYVHLSYAGALEDNRLRGGGSKSTLQSKLKTNYENIEAQFKSIVGMSSEDFLKSAAKYGDLLTTFIKMFNSDTIGDIEKLGSEETRLRLEEAGEAAERMIQAAKVSGYSNILGQLLTKKDEKGIESYIKTILESFSGINLYEEFLKGISSDGGQSLDSKKRAMSLSLIKLIFYHLITQAALDRPPPKADITILSPFFSLPDLTSSSKAIATLADEVLPYFSIFTTNLSIGILRRFAAYSIILIFA